MFIYTFFFFISPASRDVSFDVIWFFSTLQIDLITHVIFFALILSISVSTDTENESRRNAAHIHEYHC